MNNWQDLCYKGENGLWYRKDTGERTYPSWEKRRVTYKIFPERPIPACSRDKRLAFALKHLFQGRDMPLTNVAKSDIIEAVREIEPGIGKREAYRLVKRLWKCNLIDRTGNRDPRSGRLRYQKWHLR